MEDETWKPPSEAELKVIKARRERSDKISNVMGQYLLKGYKMLGTCCDSCGTILLQDKQQQLYCVACSEIDNEHSKDDPALSGEAARRQIEESGHRLSPEENVIDSSSINRNIQINNLQTVNEESPSTSSRSDNLMFKSEKAIKSTMSWAVESLDGCRCVENCVGYCNLIKSCAEALISLKQLNESHFIT